MEDLIEILLDLINNGSIEMFHNKKVPKWIRIIISVIIVSIIIGLMVLGIILIKESIFGGTILFIVGIILLVLSIVEIRRYIKNKQ